MKDRKSDRNEFDLKRNVSSDLCKMSKVKLTSGLTGLGAEVMLVGLSVSVFLGFAFLDVDISLGST